MNYEGQYSSHKLKLHVKKNLAFIVDFYCYRIQEVDDSFFEKFGSILKQASQRAALEEATPLAPLKETEEQDGEQKIEADLQSESRSLARDSDSGNETLLDTDSEPDDPDKIDLYVEAVGWNVSKVLL